MDWIKDTVFYNIYPLGFCGAPKENDGVLTYRLDKIYDWIPHIKSLSANAVVFNPVFESSKHGYDTKDYYNIDCRLGDNESFKKICDALHQNGIKVLLDGVFNHVGREFFAFKDIQNTHMGSIYCDWFSNLSFDRQSPKGDNFSYEGWAGHYDLVKLNLKNRDVVSHLLSAVEFWIDEFDIDGLRLDAADCIDLDFFRQLRNTCKSKKSDFWLYGEITNGDYNRWANSDTLDSVTNYEVYKALYSSHNDRNYFEFAHSLEREYGNYGIYKNLYLYNFADNHDVNRVASSLNDKELLKNVYTMLYTMPGAPSIYYGSEFGLQGERSARSDHELRPCLDLSDIEKGDMKLLSHIRRLGKIYHSLDALKFGEYKNEVIQLEHLCYSLKTPEQSVYVLLNQSGDVRSIGFDTGFEGKLTDVLNGNKCYDCHGYVNIDVPPKSSMILIANDGSFTIDYEAETVGKAKACNEKKPVCIAEHIEIFAGKKYRHFKGNEYEVVCFAKDSETTEKTVVYKALYGDNEIWVRPYDEFSGLVNKDTKAQRRFEPID